MEEDENPVLKQAMEELAHLSGTPGFKRIVEAREGFIRDQNTAIKEGKKEIAKKLLLENMDIEKIAEITELSVDEVEKLKKK